MGDAWHDEDLVFTDGAGGALRGNHILQRQFAPLLQRAGLPAIRLHDLRHTAASLLAHQGVHVTVVSRLLGRSSTSMTLDIYSHAFPEAQRDTTAALDHLPGAPHSRRANLAATGLLKTHGRPTLPPLRPGQYGASAHQQFAE